MQEHTGRVTLGGNPLTLLGDLIQVGQQAPDFTALANDLSPFQLSSLQGKVVVLSTVPSLDTPVCDRETRRFDEEAGRFGDRLRVLTLSMDLPFAQRRWMAEACSKHVTTLSDHRDAVIGPQYGLLIKELRLLARAVVVIDEAGVVRHVQLVPEVAQEPDYDKILEVVRQLLG